jgi:hypothetical protein
MCLGLGAGFGVLGIEVNTRDLMMTNKGVAGDFFILIPFLFFLFRFSSLFAFHFTHLEYQFSFWDHAIWFPDLYAFLVLFQTNGGQYSDPSSMNVSQGTCTLCCFAIKIAAESSLLQFINNFGETSARPRQGECATRICSTAAVSLHALALHDTVIWWDGFYFRTRKIGQAGPRLANDPIIVERVRDERDVSGCRIKLESRKFMRL